MSHLSRLVLAVALLAGLSVVATPATSLGATSRFKATPTSTGFAWSPTTRTVAKGDRVVWSNPTDRQHTVTAYKGSWTKNSTVNPGDHTAKVFKRAGTYFFRCTIHSQLAPDGSCSGMCGSVKVTR